MFAASKSWIIQRRLQKVVSSRSEKQSSLFFLDFTNSHDTSRQGQTLQYTKRNFQLRNELKC